MYTPGAKELHFLSKNTCQISSAFGVHIRLPLTSGYRALFMCKNIETEYSRHFPRFKRYELASDWWKWSQNSMQSMMWRQYVRHQHHHFISINSLWASDVIWRCKTLLSVMVFGQFNSNPWACYQIRKIAGCACAGNAGNVFPPPTSKETAC